MVRYVVVAALLLTTTTARSEGACADEMARLCPRSRGDLLLVGCLRSHQAELSQACQGDLDAVLEKAKEVGAGCEGDVYNLCHDVKPGDGRVAACLSSQQANLSTSCQESINDWRLMRMRLMAGCAGDIGSLCQNVPEGGGRIWACLKAHRADLTSDCRDAMDKL